MAETGNGMFPLVMCNVGFAAGDRAILRDVNLTLEAGRRTVVLGPNGAGKSVTLRLLHGLLRPTTGEITWGGKTAQPTAQA
ncbi:MAG TPA: ABC transporter ATP-binding protein, partial [Plasticicumulans sp.]|nr:ABC transporter ATP-binding protein [Plasticicumulans sp.]